MQISFKKFLMEELNPGSFITTADAGLDNQFFGIGRSLNMPTPTLEVPTKKIQGKIVKIDYTSNPISIHLSDGTTWMLSKKQWDYLKSTNKEPRIYNHNNQNNLNTTAEIEMTLDGTVRSVVIR